MIGEPDRNPAFPPQGKRTKAQSLALAAANVSRTFSALVAIPKCIDTFTLPAPDAGTASASSNDMWSVRYPVTIPASLGDPVARITVFPASS